MRSEVANVRAIDRAIAMPVVAALRAQIVAARPADSGTRWCAFDAAPRSLVEQVIHALRAHVAGVYVGAEWWFRACPTDLGFPFHFDRDEGIRNAIVSPDLASILYLSGAGGPTVIVDAAPGRATAPRRAIGVHPRAGRFAMFPGALLHGVLPGSASRWPRVTLLVNWWRATPRLERARGRFASPRRDVVDRRRTRPRTAPLAAIDPARVFANAAWRDLIATQTSYR